MNKIKKFLTIISSNILIFLFILLLCEIIVYKYYTKSSYEKYNTLYPQKAFHQKISIPSYMIDLESYFNGSSNIYSGRTPDGIEYKTSKKPIVIFGCSVAVGQFLEYNQTLSYKLAHRLKRTVYNRAISGGSFQHMYMQSESESLYKTINTPDTIIYMMISDHYRRSLVSYFNIIDNFIYLHYSIKQNKLIKDNYKNIYKLFFRSLYTVKFINHLYVSYFIHTPENSNKITDDTILYFTETKKNLQKHWGENFKFIIIMYEDWDILYKEELKNKLENNGFIVISTKEITDEDLRNEKYQMQDNHHPTEKAWDLLTPKIIKKLDL